MTYKEQYAWLTDRGFIDTDICSGNSILWRKALGNLYINLFWSQLLYKYWRLSIRHIDDDYEMGITVADLPDDFDFNQLNGFIDSLSSVVALNFPLTSSK